MSLDHSQYTWTFQNHFDRGIHTPSSSTVFCCRDQSNYYLEMSPISLRVWFKRTSTSPIEFSEHDFKKPHFHQICFCYGHELQTRFPYEYCELSPNHLGGSFFAWKIFREIALKTTQKLTYNGKNNFLFSEKNCSSVCDESSPFS